MTKRLIPILLLTAFALLPTRTQAFDGDRKGFVFGFGAGYGAASNEYTTSNGLATAFKIGGGASSNLLIYYSNRVVFFDGDMTQGMSAAAVSYFLESGGRSLFFSGEVGLAGRLRYNSSGSSDARIGFAIGVGYEFAPHYLLEANFMSAKGGIRNISIAVGWLGF